MTRAFVIWGCGGQANVLLDAVAAAGFEIAAIVSDGGETGFAGKKVTTWNNLLSTYDGRPPTSWSCAVAIGGALGAVRLDRLARMAKAGLAPVSLVHPTASILSGTTLGNGCQILVRAVIGVNSTIGDGVIINSGAIVDHDCTIGRGCHVGPGAVVLGRVSVGERCFFGANSTILPDLTIAADVTIGAGSVVTRDLLEIGTYVGSPATMMQPRKGECA